MGAAKKPKIHGASTLLRAAGLRPTRQRTALAELLFDRYRHVTADALHEEAAIAGVEVSLATVYNTLHQFADVGLLREVVVDTGPTYFDTNISEHHHLFYEDSGELVDLDARRINVTGLPRIPKGSHISRVDVVVRVRKA